LNAVRFRRSAQRDVQQAFEYFEAKSPGLGVESVERVEEAAAIISRNPETYQTVFQDVRRASLRQFKYALFYRIEADGCGDRVPRAPAGSFTGEASRMASSGADMIRIHSARRYNPNSEALPRDSGMFEEGRATLRELCGNHRQLRENIDVCSRRM
jgi:plasmid stabilization system protein ParE